MSNISIDLGKVSITLGGEWSRGQSYEKLTEVVNPADGRGYISLKDNINVEPGTDPTTWKPCVNPGKSLYELAVDHGYTGTEEEFVQRYNTAVSDAQNAASVANLKMQQFSEDEQARTDAENNRASAEIERERAAAAVALAESDRVTAEESRKTAETARANAEQLREQDYNTTKQQCTTAASLASEKALLADEKALLADEKATLADTKAGLANTAAAAANSAAEAANTAAQDVTTPVEVLAEHIARLEEDMKALKEAADHLGDARAVNLTLDNLFKICGQDFYTEGPGAPTTAGACKFAEHYDTTHGVFYKYNGSTWKALN